MSMVSFARAPSVATQTRIRLPTPQAKTELHIVAWMGWDMVAVERGKIAVVRRQSVIVIADVCVFF